MLAGPRWLRFTCHRLDSVDPWGRYASSYTKHRTTLLQTNTRYLHFLAVVLTFLFCYVLKLSSHLETRLWDTSANFRYVRKVAFTSRTRLEPQQAVGDAARLRRIPTKGEEQHERK